ncbi:MAG: serine/threonine protein kinase [Myxococcales bacterium]|nr:serine/threonine protein kinase [Myxococcales bacterium]
MSKDDDDSSPPDGADPAEPVDSLADTLAASDEGGSTRDERSPSSQASLGRRSGAALIVAAPIVAAPIVAVRVASRYELLGLAGEGAHGTVFKAFDTLTESPVAVKLLKSRAPSAVLRAEIATLRALDLPGVVRFLDDGDFDGSPFLVTEWVTGTPFPGPVEGWDQLEDRFVALLEIVDRLHTVGVLHRDLKPANILVDANGLITVLDLGVAISEVAPDRRSLAGTPMYLAPEVLGGERPPSVQSDLYALGVTLAEALGCGTLFSATTVGELYAEKQRLPKLSPTIAVPNKIEERLRTLLAPSAAARPDSCAAVVRALVGSRELTGWTQRLSAGSGPLTEEQLQPLFHGPERVLHLPTLGARALFARTEGDRVAVEQEVAAWVRAGIASWDGDQLRTCRPELDRLDVSPDVLALRATGSLRETHEESARGRARALIDAAERRRQAGRIGAATALAGAAWTAARGVGDFDLLDDVALVIGRCGTQFEDRHALDVGIAQLEALETDAADNIARLLRCLRTTLSGDTVDRMLDEYSRVEPFADRVLERGLALARSRIAEREGDAADRHFHVELIATAQARGDAALAADARGWAAQADYRAGDFKRCAAERLAAAARTESPIARLSFLAAAAGALIELDDDAAVLEIADAVVVEAQALGAQSLELHAWGLLRRVRYRNRTPVEPDAELRAAAQLSVRATAAAVVLLNEAAIAWRVGDHPTAIHCCRQAVLRFEHQELRAGAMLGRCFSALLGDPEILVESLRNELAVCEDGLPPGVRDQCRRLLGAASQGVPTPAPNGAGRRREVLADDEFL